MLKSKSPTIAVQSCSLWAYGLWCLNPLLFHFHFFNWCYLICRHQSRQGWFATRMVGLAQQASPPAEISRELSYGVFSRTTHCNLPSKSDSAKGAVSVNTWGHAWDEIVIRLHRSLLIHFNDFSLQTVCRDMSSDGSCYMFGRPLAIPAIQA